MAAKRGEESEPSRRAFSTSVLSRGLGRALRQSTPLHRTLNILVTWMSRKQLFETRKELRQRHLLCSLDREIRDILPAKFRKNGSGRTRIPPLASPNMASPLTSSSLSDNRLARASRITGESRSHSVPKANVAQFLVSRSSSPDKTTSARQARSSDRPPKCKRAHNVRSPTGAPKANELGRLSTF